MKLWGYNIERNSNGNGIAEVKNVVGGDIGRKRKSVDQYHILEQKFQTKQDIRTLRTAIDTADNIVNYNRYYLHEIYRRCLRDLELSAQWNTRVLKTIDKEFVIESIDDEEVSRPTIQMFKAPWFHDWIRAVLEIKLWGFSLIEFGPWDEMNNCFKPYIDSVGIYHDAIEVVDRDYVKPEFGKIVPHYGDGQDKGVSYLSTKFSDRLMFIGSRQKEPTLLFKAAAYALMKENAAKNWSEWAEVFAMDMRVGRTEAQGTERDKFVKALRDMGSNGYAVIDMDDVIEYVGVNRQDAYEVYQRFLEYIDAKISKLIFGQDVITNNTGRVVGKVGEEVSNMYGDSDAKFVEWVINTELLPFMAAHGAEVDGMKFRYDTTEKVKLTERAKIDKAIADMGFRISDEYIERTYGTDIEEYIGVPYTGVKQEEE